MDKFWKLNFVHATDFALIYMCLFAVALLQIAQIGLADDYLAIALWFVEIGFLAVVMVIIWSIVRFEQRYS